jgi:hypothetical protein
MYNKLFTSILDSSIWLEQPATKVVWVTLIAAMDEDGFAHFSAIQNLANRAVLPLNETEAAVTILESPDTNSADREHEGRRIERVPGGWMVLNARKYHDLTTRAVAKEKVRQRVQKHRLRKKIAPQTQDQRNADVTASSENTSEKSSDVVTPSYQNVTVSETESDLRSGTHSTCKSSRVSSTCTQAYTKEEQEVIADFNRILVPLGWLPVNRFMTTVQDAIACRSAAEWRTLFEKVAPDRSEWPTRRTFVRLNWDNY